MKLVIALGRWAIERARARDGQIAACRNELLRAVFAERISASLQQCLACVLGVRASLPGALKQMFADVTKASM